MRFAGRREIVVLTVIALGISAAIGGTIWAQDKTAPAIAAPAAENAWIKRCDDIKDGEKVTGKYCEAVQSLSVTQKDADPSTAQRIIEIAIGYPPANKGNATLAVILPLGIFVDKEVELAVDGSKAKSFNIRYCDVGGCFAMFEMDDALITKFREGKEITVKSQAATGQPLMINLSLAGLATVLDNIKPKS